MKRSIHRAALQRWALDRLEVIVSSMGPRSRNSILSACRASWSISSITESFFLSFSGVCPQDPKLRSLHTLPSDYLRTRPDSKRRHSAKKASADGAESRQLGARLRGALGFARWKHVVLQVHDPRWFSRHSKDAKPTSVRVLPFEPPAGISIR